jgi:hypothetical protein
LYLAAGFPFLAAGLVVPFPWLILLWLVYLAGLIWAVTMLRRRPLLVLLFAPAAVAFWFLFVSAGERFLGWTG